MADFSHTKRNNQKPLIMDSFPVPEKCFLQLSFSVAAANRVCVAAANQICIAACLCSFLRNLLALNFARFAHKISGSGGKKMFVCSGREVSVPAATCRFPLLPTRSLPAAAAAAAARRARTAQIFKQLKQKCPTFLKNKMNETKESIKKQTRK
ncbi:hypothetical protein [Methanimicrococcus hongohii]|uniref:hypothetical protein n=1 Tax=Methanimicrococcus hongohii TaxID=3028295 RepID=UPI00292D30AE|nr:hypothetical protein [Methanimicrococcus sp. Hf6]